MDKLLTPVTLTRAGQSITGKSFTYKASDGQRLVLCYEHNGTSTTIYALTYESEAARVLGRSVHVGGAKGNFPPDVILRYFGFEVVSEEGAEP